VPETITSIGQQAFEGCTSLTTISLAETVTSIGQQAFRDCTGLVTVNLPEAVSIGNAAFLNCTNLTTVTLPKVETLGNAVFQGCTGLATVILGNTPPTTVGTTLFVRAATDVVAPKTITFKAPSLAAYTATPWSDKVNMTNAAAGDFWDSYAATKVNLTVNLEAL
jgi:hypothetical protein